ncbi:unnamed protein product, partial [Meganyctiphanes norvegica]
MMVNVLLLCLVLMWTTAVQGLDGEPNEQRMGVQVRRIRGCQKLKGKCVKRRKDCPEDLPEETSPGRPYCHCKRHRCCYPDCKAETKAPCKQLNGTCMRADEDCDGRSVIGKGFCGNNQTCKCCFPRICPPTTGITMTSTTTAQPTTTSTTTAQPTTTSTTTAQPTTTSTTTAQPTTTSTTTAQPTTTGFCDTLRTTICPDGTRCHSNASCISFSGYTCKV